MDNFMHIPVFCPHPCICANNVFRRKPSFGAPAGAQSMLFESLTSEKAWWTRRKRQYYTTTCELNLSLIISYVSTLSS